MRANPLVFVFLNFLFSFQLDLLQTLLVFQELEVEKAAKRQRKQAVTAFYNVNSMATKQNVWAKLIHENKQKEKDIKESPLQKIIRVRNNIHKWRKLSSVQSHSPKVYPSCTHNFEEYATEHKPALEIHKNIAYFFNKWRATAHYNPSLYTYEKSSTGSHHSKKIRFDVNDAPTSLMPTLVVPWSRGEESEAAAHGSATDPPQGHRGLTPRSAGGSLHDVNRNSAGSPPGTSLGPEQHAYGHRVDLAEHVDNCDEVPRGESCVQEESRFRHGGDLAQNKSGQAQHRQARSGKNKSSPGASDFNINAADNLTDDKPASVQGYFWNRVPVPADGANQTADIPVGPATSKTRRTGVLAPFVVPSSCTDVSSRSPVATLETIYWLICC